MANEVLQGRYTLVRELGRGGMGVVWLAEDQVLGRQVAVKQLLALDGGHTASLRFIREARLAGQLSNPCIVTVYDVFHEAGVPHVVMELLDGANLADQVEHHGPLPVHQVAAIGIDLLSALTAAHTVGIVHRDVKPANVMLTQTGAKLTDFGIAHSSEDTRLTSAGLLIGSPAYMAPERLNGHDADPATDLWALGATLFYAAEGRQAFQRVNLEATMAAVLTEQPKLENTRGPLAEAITGLLAPAGDRIDAATARILLEQAHTGTSLERPPRSRKHLIYGGAAVATVAVAAVVILSPTDSGQPNAAPDPVTQPVSTTPLSATAPVQPPCSIDQVKISGAPGHRPSVTIPRGCTSPTSLVVHDVTSGTTGVPVTDHDDEQLSLNLRTEAVTWSGRPVWSDWDLHVAPRILQGHRATDGLSGMRPGGRRTIFVPPHDPYWSALRDSRSDSPTWPADEPVILVVDLIS